MGYYPYPTPAPAPIATPIPTPTPTPYTPPDIDIIEEEPTNFNNVYTNPLYTQAYLSQNVGRYVKVDFLIGTNMFVDREGVLKEVGISYIILQEPETDDLLLCDLYSIKFVKFFF